MISDEDIRYMELLYLEVKRRANKDLKNKLLFKAALKNQQTLFTEIRSIPYWDHVKHIPIGDFITQFENNMAADRGR